MSTIAIHGAPGSPYVASALFVLEERQAPYRIVPMTPDAAFLEHKRPEHLKLHPFGRMPVIEDDGFFLYETQAILRYVAAKFPGEPLTPASITAAARMNQMIGITDWYFYPQVVATIVLERKAEHLLHRSPNEAVIEQAIPGARNCVGEIESLMAGKPYLAGEALSLADLHMLPFMHYLSTTPEGADLLGECRGLTAWLDRMRRRPAVKNLHIGL